MSKSIKVIPLDEGELLKSPQGHKMIIGVSHSICGSEKIAGAFAYTAPGLFAKAHYHEYAESIFFCLEGWGATLCGPELKPLFIGPGEFLYIPEKVVHAAVNLSKKHPCIVVQMRTERDFNEDVILVPEYDDQVAVIAADLQNKFEAGTLPLRKGWEKTLGKPFIYEE